MTNQDQILECWEEREIKLFIDNTQHYYNRLQDINKALKDNLFTTDHYLHERKTIIRYLVTEYKHLINAVIDSYNAKTDDKINLTDAKINMIAKRLYLREIEEIKFNLTTNLGAIKTIHKIVLGAE